MGVSRRSRVPECITRPDERFDSSQVDGFVVKLWDALKRRSQPNGEEPGDEPRQSGWGYRL